MRELTLLETGYLAGLLLLSLVLPLLMSFRGPRDETTRKLCLKIVWSGQILGFLAGLGILGSPLVAPYAAALGCASCLACAILLLRRFQIMRPGQLIGGR